MEEEVNIEGSVTVRQGDEVLVEKAKNTLVGNAFKGMIKVINADEYSDDNEVFYEGMYLQLGRGGDILTQMDWDTLNNSYALEEEPSDIMGLSVDDDEESVQLAYQFQISSSKLEEADVEEVDELGIFWNIDDDFKDDRWSWPDRLLGARLAEVEENLTPFTVDQSQSLTIEWAFRLVI